MKTISKTIAVLCFAFFSSSAWATSDTTVVIKTSAECGSCKKRIENALNFEKGVNAAVLDVASKNATVTFDTKKTTVEKLREAISNVGYDADNVPANEKKYNKLPACCKKGGMPK